jgi:eukaryotic-like serine/threonine-protein kinase
MQSVALHHFNLKSLVYANMALIPLVPIALFQLRKTYTAVAAGYSIDDLRAALRAWSDQRRVELAAAATVPEPFWVGLLRMIPPLCAALIPIAFVFGTMFAGQPLNIPSPGFQSLVNGLAVAVMASIGLAAGLGVPLLPPAHERKIVGRIRTFLWNSRVGAWLARALTPKDRGVPEANFRPTEMALEMAVDDLFAALPAAYRQAVGDLPAVAHRLSQHVGELRVEVERLETMKAHARREETGAIDPLLVGARTQLSQTVSALETIRMELLRLHGGASNVRPLTTSLDSARNMMEHIARLRDAEDEIEPRARKRLAIDSRTPSPA